MLNEVEQAVLAAYLKLEEQDPEGAFAPYYNDVAAAAEGDAELAYAACKRLKAAKLLDCGARQGSRLITAPPYWITDAGKTKLDELAQETA